MGQHGPTHEGTPTTSQPPVELHFNVTVDEAAKYGSDLAQALGHQPTKEEIEAIGTHLEKDLAHDASLISIAAGAFDASFDPNSSDNS